MLEADGGELKVVRDLVQDCREAGAPPFTAPYYRQRLYVNPKTSYLYLAEGDWKANGKSFHELIEIDRYGVAVLDSAGNVVTRIGTYGNADDGRPLVADGGPPGSRSIGGDEVALFHAPYLATDTDRRLFIADPGNGRILSVQLGYHAEETIALSDVSEQ